MPFLAFPGPRTLGPGTAVAGRSTPTRLPSRRLTGLGARFDTSPAGATTPIAAGILCDRNGSARIPTGDVAASSSSAPAVPPVLLGARCSRPHPGPDTSLAAHPAEQSRTGFFQDLELGVHLVDAQLVQGRLFGLLDAASSGLNPLHLSVPHLPRLLRFRRPPARGRVPPRWPFVPGRFALAPFEDPPF